MLKAIIRVEKHMEELKSVYLRKDNDFSSITYFEVCVWWKLFLTVFSHILLAFIFNVSSLTSLVFASRQMADVETLRHSRSVCRQAFGAVRSHDADEAGVMPSKKFRVLLNQRLISSKVKSDVKRSTRLSICVLCSKCGFMGCPSLWKSPAVASGDSDITASPWSFWGWESRRSLGYSFIETQTQGIQGPAACVVADSFE